MFTSSGGSRNRRLSSTASLSLDEQVTNNNSLPHYRATVSLPPCVVACVRHNKYDMDYNIVLLKCTRCVNYDTVCVHFCLSKSDSCYSFSFMSPQIGFVNGVYLLYSILIMSFYVCLRVIKSTLLVDVLLCACVTAIDIINYTDTIELKM